MLSYHLRHPGIVFCNIDWKRTRHASIKSTRRNLQQLQETIQSIVRNCTPSVLALCEVGETGRGMAEIEMHEIIDAICTSWKAATTRSVDLASSWDQQQPYLTLWNRSEIQCFEFKILRNLVEDQPLRTAQAFGCRAMSAAAAAEFDVVNVHLASSTKHVLTDARRTEALHVILRSPSCRGNELRLGQGRCLIGGDMNTSAMLMSSLLKLSLAHAHLQLPLTQVRMIRGRRELHGDLVIAIGMEAVSGNRNAVNHDPKHDPVAIEVGMHRATAAASAQPSYRDSSFAGHATEQSASIARYSPGPTRGAEQSRPHCWATEWEWRTDKQWHSHQRSSAARPGSTQRHHRAVSQDLYRQQAGMEVHATEQTAAATEPEPELPSSQSEPTHPAPAIRALESGRITEAEGFCVSGIHASRARTRASSNEGPRIILPCCGEPTHISSGHTRRT